MKNQKKLFLTYFVMICALILTTISTAQAATFTVNVDTDQKDMNPGDGVCAAAYRACTLRAAIQEANLRPGDDMIVFSAGFKAPNPPKTIVLSLGELFVTTFNGGNTQIYGPGARQLIIDGDHKSRVFVTDSLPGHNDIISISHLTIQNGMLKDAYNSKGAGIYNNTNLILSNVTIRNNDTNPGDYVQAFEKIGGGIYTEGGFVNITNSTISNNAAVQGGGVYSMHGTVYISGSTISGNSSKSDGGGVYLRGGFETSSIKNSTFAGNSAQQSGGGIFIYQYGNSAVVVGNAIVADNSAQIDKDVSGLFISKGNNLIESRGNSTGYIASDLPDGTDPKLGFLKNNGGPTDTRALLPNSPAINAGNDCIASYNCVDEFYYDQRGYGFPRKVGSSVDIGAFEFQGENSAVVQISGKVLKPNGRGLNNAVVTLTSTDGEPLSVETDSHGNFSFDSVTPGRSYIISAESRQYNYTPQNIFVTEARNDVNFVPLETREPADAPR
jgi:CSLREA domain-containing protein